MTEQQSIESILSTSQQQQEREEQSILQIYTDKLNNGILTISKTINEIKFQYRTGKLIKRRCMLQKRMSINHAKAIHQRKKHLHIESQKNRLREYFNKI